MGRAVRRPQRGRRQPHHRGADRPRRLAGPSDVDRAVNAARGLPLTPARGPRDPPPSARRHDPRRRADRRAWSASRRRSRSRSAPAGHRELAAVAAKLYLDWHAAQAGTYPWEEEREGIRGGCWCAAGPSAWWAPSPWNFPLALSFPKIAPALLTGSPRWSSSRPRRRRCSPSCWRRRSRMRACRPASSTSCPPTAGSASCGAPPAGRQDQLHRRRAPGAGSPRYAASRSSAAASSWAASPPSCCCRRDLDAVVPDLAPNTMRNNVRRRPTRRARGREAAVEVVRGAAGGDRRLSQWASPRTRTSPSARSSVTRSASGWSATSPPAVTRWPGSCGGGRPDRDRGYFVGPTIFADVDSTNDRAGGDLRPMVVRDPLRRHGPRGRDRQRLQPRSSGSVWGGTPREGPRPSHAGSTSGTSGSSSNPSTQQAVRRSHRQLGVIKGENGIRGHRCVNVELRPSPSGR